VPTGTVPGVQQWLRSYSARSGGVRVHFVATFDPPPIASGGWTDPDAPIAGETSTEGTSAGLWLEFPPGTTEVTARIAPSYVDLSGAIGNPAAQLPDRSTFGAVPAAPGDWGAKHVATRGWRCQTACADRPCCVRWRSGWLASVPRLAANLGSVCGAVRAPFHALPPGKCARGPTA